MTAAHITNALLAVILGLSGWTLSRVVGQAEALATIAQKVATSEHADQELRTRLLSAETRMASIELQLAVFSANLPK